VSRFGQTGELSGETTLGDSCRLASEEEKFVAEQGAKPRCNSSGLEVLLEFSGGGVTDSAGDVTVWTIQVHCANYS